MTNRVMGRILASMKQEITGWNKAWGSDGKGKVHLQQAMNAQGGLEV
jgi:hypothetical protein